MAFPVGIKHAVSILMTLGRALILAAMLSVALFPSTQALAQDSSFVHPVGMKSYEVLLPDDLFDVCAPITAGGLYIDEEKLSRPEEVRLRELFKGRHVPGDKIDEYIEFLGSRGNIVYPTRGFQCSDFQQIRLHEHVHKFIDQLSTDDQKKLESAAAEVRSQSGSSWWDWLMGKSVLQSRTPEKAYIVRIAREKWQEFYAYLAMDAFVPEVKDALNKDCPDAYAIYLQVVEAATKAVR
jgi:hypothetical protein